MQQPSKSSLCPTCKSPIPADAPGGLCPTCTLEGAASVPHTGTGGRHLPPPSIEEIAAHFPELEILELLGAGGMGAVYKARQPQLDRMVALKILSHELAQEPAFVERFNREGKVLARLSHPNIVGIFDFGTAGPYCYLLMEYVDGVNLRQAMRTGGFKPDEALALVQDVCSALQFAHEEGILHRDIKPENILIDSKGRVKIADFGIAKLVGGGAASDVTLTLQGSILGSPHYMAPEQIETPGDIDQRADIYSLGVVLYEMLTGGLPIGRFALPSEKAAMDARIDEIVMRTLEKERERRYQTVSELKTGFEGIEGPVVPSQAAFISDQLLEGSKYTFWMAMIFLVLVFINVGSSLSGDTDELLDASGLLPFLAGAAILLSTVSAVLRAIHTIRKQGSHSGGSGPQLAHGHAPIQRDQVTSHLGLTAAILTGVSLLLAGVTLYVANTLRDADMRMIAIVVGVSLDGTIAFLGFILGANALGDIRKSGGTKDGLGFAIFAVVTWPICLMAALIQVSLSEPMPGSGGSGIPTSLAVLLAGIPLVFAGYALIRGLRRWARGVVRKDGQRHFPGLTGTLLATLGLAILGPLLAAVLPPMLEPSHDPFEEHRMPMGREVPGPKSFYPNKVDWHRGAPERIVPIKIHDGFRAEFRLALYDGNGNFQKGVEIGSWTPFLRRKNLRVEDIETCLVKVGTTPSEGESGNRGVTAIIESNGARGTLIADTDFAEWDFDCDELKIDLPHLPLASAGSYAHTLAKREEEIDGKTKRTGRLQLEVQLIER